MKARSKKFLGAAVVAAAMAAYATPSAHAVPAIVYELSAASSTVTSGAAGSVSFDVLGLVTGSNLSQTGLVGSEFSLVQTPSGITGTLDFQLSSTYNEQGSSSSHTAFFGSVPGVGGNGNQGAGAGNVGTATPSGAVNDTIVGYTGISGMTVSNSAPAPVGTQVISGTTYNVYDLGTGHFNYGVQTPAAGSTVSIAVVPRVGLGNLIKPQVAIINGTVAAFAGNDATNVSSTPLTLTVGTTTTLLGDMNGDGFVDSNDLDPFFEALFNPTQYETDFPGINENVVGDINMDGFFDSNDIDPFIALVFGGSATLESSALHALTPAVPEPASLGLLAMTLPLLAKRRRGR